MWPTEEVVGNPVSDGSVMQLAAGDVFLLRGYPLPRSVILRYHLYAAAPGRRLYLQVWRPQGEGSRDGGEGGDEETDFMLVQQTEHVTQSTGMETVSTISRVV